MFGEGDAKQKTPAKRATSFASKASDELDNRRPLIQDSDGSPASEESEAAANNGMPLPPVGMLAVYTLINMLTYFDRGALSGSLDNISKDLNGISNAQQGFLGSAFMGGYMIASPIFAHFVAKVRCYNPLVDK